jgi:predicted dehydrogenase
VKRAAAAAAALTAIPSRLARGYGANEKLNIGIIGAGGRGGANLQGVSGENIVALCDIDRGRLRAAANRYPNARAYSDFRRLLSQENTLDAVVVSTPDHSHAPACVPAMQKGLHCYCEKPLTHDVHEARVMTQLAAEKRLVTHMGTPGRGGESTIRTVEIIRSGAIGDVVEAHFWTNRPIWPQGFDRPPGEDAVPQSLDWENFIGTAPMRPYVATWPDGHPVYQLPPGQRHANVYHPFVWRGWWDFGTGALGDIAPHMWHPAYWGCELGAPASVEVVDASGPVTEMFPAWSILRFDFPARQDRPAVKLFWYDGGKKPASEVVGGGAAPDGGWVIVGTKASLGTGNRSTGEFESVQSTLRRPGDMYQEWIAGIKAGDPDRPSCPFSYAGPLTEAYLLGNIALKVGGRIEWDPRSFRITNGEEANRYLRREYRKGWGL